MTQNKPTAKQIDIHHSIIAKYERDEVKPSIDVAIKLANVLNTIVGYLLGEVTENDTFKEPVMLKRLQQINSLPDKDKECILYAIDNLLASANTRLAFGK